MEKKDKRIYTMSEERPVKAVLKMGLPVTAGMMVMVFYNLVDTFFIGMLDDPYQLAATNLSYPVMMVMVALSAIVANGGASYISRCMGAGNMDEANHTLMIGFEMVIVGSGAIMAAGLLFLDSIMDVLGTDSTTLEYTREYTQVLLVGAFFIVGNYTIGQLLRSEGSVMPSMMGLIAGTIANIVLDPIFIFLFGFGVRGAAIATVLGNVLGVAIFLWYYCSGKTLLHLSAKYLSPDGKIIKEILWVGFPHTLEQFMTTAGTVVMNNLAAGYGGLTVAAMGIATKLITFGTYIYQGMTAGSQPIIGYCYGAGNSRRMKQIIFTCIGVTTCFELVVMGVYAIGAGGLVGLFTDSAHVTALGVQTLRAMIFILPFVSTTNVVRNTYGAMGKPIPSFVITVFRQLVLYIPFMVLFNRAGGYDALIFSQPAAELICMVVSAAMILQTLKKMAARTCK